MADIDIGPDAKGRDSTQIAGYTFVMLDNPANASGKIDKVELWFNTNAGGVKVGTFSRRITSNFTCRDFATIGNVTAGSKQTFTGLDIDVVVGDFIGIFFSSGTLEWDEAGYAGAYYKEGDQFETGEQAYSPLFNDAGSVYGESVEAPPEVKAYGLVI